MKTKLIIGLVILAGVANAQQGSSLEYKIASSRGASGNVKVNISDLGTASLFNMIIPQMPGGGINIKSLTKKSNPDVTYIVNDNTKTFSETKNSETAKEDTKTYLVKKIGNETVNGYKCVHAVITEGNETHEVWNTKDIPEYDKYADGLNSNEKIGSVRREQALKNAGCDGLPVKTIHKGSEREGDMTMELVKVERKNFTAADFEIPAGYRKAGSGSGAAQQNKSQQELLKMSPAERAKYIEEMQKAYGK